MQLEMSVENQDYFIYIDMRDIVYDSQLIWKDNKSIDIVIIISSNVGGEVTMFLLHEVLTRKHITTAYITSPYPLCIMQKSFIFTQM